jgi:putative transposase
MKAYRFRLYPSKAQDAQMRKHLWISKELWNDMLEHTKTMYALYGRFPTKNGLYEFVKGSGLYSQASQKLGDRLLDALAHKMRRKKACLQGGFPRFKSFDRMRSLYYPQSGFKLGDKLKVSPFGEINIRQHREIQGTIKTLTLKREPSGKWFAVFVADAPQEHKQNFGSRVGVDLGLKTFAALSNGEVIRNPRHLRKHEEELAFLQRRMSRKVKRSMNWRKDKLKVARLHERVANTRRDFLHKASSDLVSQYSFIALEALASKELAELDYGKSIHDAGWSMFADMLSYKAEGAGCEVVFVDPKNTTKECSRCGFLSKKELWERTHDCPSCGYQADRDLNAAEVILKRTTQGYCGRNAYGHVAKAA